MSEYVYFAQGADSGRIKIGYTTSPARRMKTLKSAAREPVTLLRLIEGDRFDESRFHYFFRTQNIEGEWFAPSPELWGCIEGLADLQVPLPPEPERPGVPLVFRLDTDVRTDLQRIAERNDRTLSAEIRRALKKHVTAEARQAA